MAVIDSILAKDAERQLKILRDDLNVSYETILKLSKVQLDFNGGSSPNSLAQFNQQMEKSIKIRQQTEQSVERVRLAEIKLQQQREKAVDAFNRQEAKQQEALRRSETAYQRIQNSVTLLTKTYQDLAIRRELGGTLTAKEEGQLLSLTNRINMYQSALKKVDADIQKNQRNVGNYASGWNGLGNSINQITREFPAFAVSANTGFLAISNNLPVLFDELQRIKNQNAELIKQGQPVKSTFSQIAGAVFSFGTALSLGVTLLTLYGGKIVSWVKSLFEGVDTTKAMVEAQKQLNSAINEGTKNAQTEIVNLKAKLAIAKNVALADKDRLIAVDALIKQYPYYFEGLTKQQILAGETAKAEASLTNAILSRAKAQAATSKITENQGKIIDLEEKRLELLNDQTKAEASLRSTQLRSYAASQAERQYENETNSIARVNSIKKEVIEVDKEIAYYEAINQRLTQYSIQQQTQAIGLDYQETKSKKEKTKARQKDQEVSELQSKQIDSTLSRLQDEIKATEKVRDAISKNSETYERFERRIEALQFQIKLITDFQSLFGDTTEKATKSMESYIEQQKKIKEAQIELNKATSQFIETFQSDFFNQAGLGSINFFTDIQENGLTAFEQMMAGAETLEKKFAVTFNAIAEVAQEAFNLINSASQSQFDAEYTRAQRQRDIAIMFAGDSATAREEIERVYEEKQREIRRREAEAQKRLAIFNIAINTAQGIVSALAMTPPNIPLSIAIGAIGAIQAGLVASQEIPQFWKGTDNAPEGWAMVDEKRPEVHTDKQGRIKSLGQKGANLRYLKAGDKIYKSHDEYIKQQLSNFSHNPLGSLPIPISSGNNSATAGEIDGIMGKYFSKIQTTNITIDKRGMQQYTAKAGQKTISANNRGTAKGFSV